MDGVRIYFEIQLDEELILEDYSKSALEQMYAFMDEVFELNDCYLEKIDGKKHIYTRNVNDEDLAYLMMAAGILDKTNWFEQYVCHYMFYIYDEESEEFEAEEDWLEECDILLRREFRNRVKEIIIDMKKKYVDDSNKFFRETFACADAIKHFLADTSYEFIEDDGFLLFHGKSFFDYKDGMRLISVNLERCQMPGIASLICLMQKNQLPDSVVVAFLKSSDEKRQEIQKMIKLLRKAKRTFRAIVLDVTNTGWEENCDFVVENCYLTQRMYKNLISALHGERNRWKIIPEDRQMLKGILFGEEYFSENVSRRNECDYYRECGVNCFGFCLPEEGDSETATIDLQRLGWYMYKLIQLAEKKI